MKLIIILLFLFCAVVAGLEQHSTELKKFEEPQSFCGKRLNMAMNFFCRPDIYHSLKNSIEDTKKS